MAEEDPYGGGWHYPNQQPAHDNPNGAPPISGMPERDPGDMPCPSGTCKDVVTMQCRSFNPNREKVNETDTWERPTGGGRGYCRQRDGGGAGGGRGGAGGAGGAGGSGAGGFGSGSGGPFGSGDPASRANSLFGSTSGNFDTIWNSLLPIARGESTRYNPQTMGYLEGQAKLDEQSGISTETNALYDDAITRGQGRSGATGRGVADITRDAHRVYAQTTTALRVKKVEADFEDRMGALDRMQKALDSRQAFIMGLDQTAAGRERDIANIALGYANIAAMRQRLQMQLDVDLQIARDNRIANLFNQTPG